MPLSTIFVDQLPSSARLHLKIFTLKAHVITFPSILPCKLKFSIFFPLPIPIFTLLEYDRIVCVPTFVTSFLRHSIIDAKI